MRVSSLLILSFSCAGVVQASTEQIDAVAEGRKIFESIGCAECHSVKKENDAFKTGPGFMDYS